MSLSPYAIPGLISTLLVVGMLPMVWSRRSARGAPAFLWMICMVALWAALQAFASIADSFDAKYLIARVQYTPISLSPLALFVFAVSYSGRSRIFRQPIGYALLMIPVLSSLLALTNPLHSLLWAEVRFNGAQLPIQTPSYGFWFSIHIVFEYLLVVASIVLIGQTFRRTQHPRGQGLLLMAAPAIVAAVNLLYLSGAGPLQPLDPTPSAFAAAIVLTGLALYRYRVFDVAPVARRVVVDELPAAVVVLDTEDRIADLNPSAVELLGRDTVGTEAAEVLPPRVVEVLSSTSLHESTEVRVEGPDAARFYDVRVTPLQSDEGEVEGRVLIVDDVTELVREELKTKELEAELRRAKASLEQRTSIDSLTGLPRREKFVERLEEEFSRSRRYGLQLSLLLLDVDCFQAVNEDHGLNVGDRVLAEIAHLIADEKRQTDFAGRFGGDEFGLLATGTDRAGARELADRLGSRTAELRVRSPKDVELLVTLSIGVATLDPQCENARQLIDRAEDALFRARRVGLNQVAAADYRE